MRPINYQLTNTILNNLIDLEKENAIISSFKLDSATREKFNEKRAIISLFHVAHLLGEDMTLKEIEKFKQGKVEVGDNLKYKILNNYRNVLEYIESTKTTGAATEDLSIDLLEHLNKLLLNNWQTGWSSKIRTDDKIDSTLDDWTVFFDDSVSQLEIQKELQNALDWYKQNVNRINPIIRISVTLYRLVRILPFQYLNKYTILAFTEYLMNKEGYFDPAFLSIPKIFDQNKSKFDSLWKDATESPSGNLTFWIESLTEKMHRELTDIRKETEEFRKEETTKLNQPFLSLNKRQLKILRYLQTIPTVKREDYVQMFNVSTMTAYRDLSDLVEKKLLKVSGEGRATMYLLANR